MVGLSAVLYPVDNSEGDAPASIDIGQFIVGIVVLLTGQVFGSLSYIFEEKFMDQFDDVDPLVVVGYEGVWGVAFNIPLLIIFNLIPCSN